MAYSDVINDKKYKSRRAANRAGRIILFVLTAAAAVSAVIFSGMPRAAGTAAVLVCVAVGCALIKPWKAFERDWEGEVVSKEKEYTYAKTPKMMITEPSKGQARDKQGNAIPYIKSILVIKKDDGSEYIYSGVDDDELPEVCYYRIGDRVRHHSGLKIAEKEDKSKDRAVLCLCCLTLTPKEEERCRKCGMPLLK